MVAILLSPIIYITHYWIDCHLSKELTEETMEEATAEREEKLI